VIEELDISPAERVAREHLAGGRFEAGVDAGHWRIVDELHWPNLVIAVRAAARANGPEEFALQFDLTDYPTRAPTAMPWDVEGRLKLSLERRPKGHRVGMAFRMDWEGGKALYVPYDRVALESHPAWRTQYPRLVWDPTKKITFYLVKVHELINDEDYEGV
jgi:hypothetical protein